MQTTQHIWFNGKIIPWDEAKIHVLTHALHYGGGAFEGIRFYKTEQGPAIYRLEDHINRLFYSAKTLDMDMPYTKEDLTAAIKQVVHLNELEEGYIRPIVYYGYGKMGVNPTGSPVELAIACWPWGAYLPHDSVNIKTSKYIRIHPRSTVVSAKLCGNYVNGVLASLEIRGTHYHEALFLDDDGNVSEGVGENFFMVKNNIIYTPTLDTILEGITRDTIIQLATKLDFKVVQTNIPFKDAYTADEGFFTGTAAEVTPIHSIDDNILGNGEIGKITQTIKKSYLDIVKGKNPEFKHYLTYL